MSNPKAFGNLKATIRDAKNATQIARGFGIWDKDIIYIHNKTIKEVDAIIKQIKIEFRELVKKGLYSFLFVYCAGHGVADQE